MAKRIQVGGRIESKEVGGIVTGAAEILDDAKGKKQSIINEETDDELLRLDQSKQDNLTFDNAPTEGSDNPVKSGGLYTAQQAILLAIAAINELIPSAASALNQLADKAFVNSSISTNTATFRGTSAAGLNEQQFLAWANGLEHDLNDYVFWQTSDAAGNTLFKRYKWNGTEWAYEYTLNNSTFTAEQWEAIQSGITALLVAKLRALPTAEQLIQSFDSKQDVLTFDDVPTLGSTNPVKSSGIYNVIKAITDLIPAEATAQNQLADKADVAEKIVAAIPSWKGQYDALTDLQAVTGAKAGDMGCVKTTDSDGHAVLTFYQYSAQGAWVVYYTLRHYAQNKPATTGTTGDYPYNGMGRIELQKNIVNGVNTLTQAMLTQQNTIYVIQYDFTLGEDITVPANCVLEFDGGSISGNGTGKNNITGTDTQIRADKVAIFTGIVIAGTWNVPNITSDWFSDAENENILKQVFNLCTDNIQNNVFIENGTYNVSVSTNNESVLVPPSNTHIDIVGTIQMKANGFPRYNMFNLNGKSNITIEGNGFLVGDALTHDYESYAETYGTKILCTDASNTPENAILYVGNYKIIGTLPPSQSLLGNVFWVRRNNDLSTPTKYLYYRVVNDDGEYIFKETNTHEWGMGIRSYNSYNIIIRGLHFKLFTGDAMSIGPSNGIVENITIEKCRRQGITIGDNVLRLYVKNSIIENIGVFTESGILVEGTNPMSAIDIEPNTGSILGAQNIILENLTINCPKTAGIKAQKLEESSFNVNNIIIKNCKITAFAPIYIKYCNNVVVNNNIINGNKNYPVIHVFSAETIRISENSINNFGIEEKGYTYPDYPYSFGMYIYKSIDSRLSSKITISNNKIDIEDKETALYVSYNAEICGNSITTNGNPFDAVTTNCSIIDNYIKCISLNINRGYFYLSKNVIECDDLGITSQGVIRIQDNIITTKRFNAILYNTSELSSNHISVNMTEGIEYSGNMLNFYENSKCCNNVFQFTKGSDNTTKYTNIFYRRNDGVFVGYNSFIDTTIDPNVTDHEIATHGTQAASANAYDRITAAYNKIDSSLLTTSVCASSGHIGFISSLTVYSSTSRMITDNKQLYNGYKCFNPSVGKLLIYNSDRWLEPDSATFQVKRSGTTDNRPTSSDIYIGFQYLDTTLGKPIYWNGTAWVDATGTVV